MEDWIAESDNQAIPMFEKAIGLDPNFARAYSSLAGIYQSRNLLSPGNPRDEQDRALALRYSHEAVRLDPVDARSHVNLAWGCMLARDFENGKRHFDLAGELNPNDASITITRGLAAAYLGDAASGIKLADRAIRLNPIHPAFFLGNLASIYFLAGRFEDTVSTIDLAPSVWPEIAAWRTSACAHLGRMDEAKHWGLRFVSDVRSSWIGETEAMPLDCVNWFFRINAIKRPEDIGLLADGLAAAGLLRPTAIPVAPARLVETNSDSEPVSC
jgi:tetratricopeptide (TPR) repeat protein